MPIGTKTLTKTESTKAFTKREKIRTLIEDHRELFNKEGITNPKFIPRMCYKHEGVSVISFFPRELYGGNNVYTEFCSRDYTPEDENRTLYKWIFNPEYESVYDLSEPHDATGDRRYLIPISELVNVTELYSESEEVEELPFEELPDPESDVPYESMTLRDHAAITWQKPVSHKKWLNQLIEKTFNQ